MNAKRRRALLTGGHGFLGTHLYHHLTAQGWQSVARFHSNKINVEDYDALYALLKAAEPKTVVHLAAKCGGIGANMAAPADFWFSNLRMGMNIIKACADLSIKLIMIGTTCSYPVNCPTPFEESNIWNGYPELTNAPYGIAKRSLLAGMQAYHKQYGLRGAYLIPTNLMGENDNFDPNTSHVIPAMIRAFHEGKTYNRDKVRLWGDGTPTRDFLYAGDCAEAIEAAMIHVDTPTPINLGSGVETSIKALAEMVATITGFEGDIEWNTTLPNGQPRRVLDTRVAKNWLGWQAKTPLFDALRRTYDWWVRTTTDIDDSEDTD